jgi:CTP synthase
MRYVLVTGGGISGIGKGIAASSVGLLLKEAGHRVTAIKIDPYLNQNAGTLSPLEHGEVFVLDDGGEADLDLGNYERFLDVTLTRDHNLTTGKIMAHVFERERNGDYLGQTVQIVPHVTDAIQAWIERVADAADADTCIIELGGTAGDLEAAPFIEALTQLQARIGRDHFRILHVSHVPIVGEQKTKPTQQSVALLRSMGLCPDVVACRCAEPLLPAVRDKIARFCRLPTANVIDACDVASIWDVPAALARQGICGLLWGGGDAEVIGKVLRWPQRHAGPRVRVAVVGKYITLTDAYLSLTHALEHAGWAVGAAVDIVWIDAEDIDWAQLAGAHAIIVPGGFGTRGTAGMIRAVEYARRHSVPFLGICLGMQIAVIEFCRNVIKMKDATSTEFDAETPCPVVRAVAAVGEAADVPGGMPCIGGRDTHFRPGSRLARLYGATCVRERHRHRYEVNAAMVPYLDAAGLLCVGRDVTAAHVHACELSGPAFFVAVQYHPEYTSRPWTPSPLFMGLLSAAGGCAPLRRLPSAGVGCERCSP